MLRKASLTVLTWLVFTRMATGCSPKQSSALAIASVPPVDRHGALSVRGPRIVDKNGSPVQLVGMSLFWSIWGGERFFNRGAVRTLATDWGASLVRAPVAVEPRGGWLDNADATRRRLRDVVESAVQNGIYVLIDWHEEHAHQHVKEATAFFEEMAREFGSKPNVIFELWNEPAGKEPPVPSWADIKAYAEAVLPAIRRHSSNLVVVGTPSWSQHVEQAADDPLSDPNVAYALHFYAGSHGRELRDKADYALSKNIALFITEWGTTIHDGGNTDKHVYEQASSEWLAWADRNQLSWANWSIMDKSEASSALTLDAEDEGPWPDAVITRSGLWVRERIRQTRSRLDK